MASSVLRCVYIVPILALAYNSNAPTLAVILLICKLAYVSYAPTLASNVVMCVDSVPMLALAYCSNAPTFACNVEIATFAAEIFALIASMVGLIIAPPLRRSLEH